MPRIQQLPPGFMVVHGNHPESLRDLLLAWMARHPLAPLEDEVVLVQSNGIAQWLKMSMAAPAAQGGRGIAAAIRTQLPSQALWQAYRHVLGRDQVPETSAFDKSRLVWRLMRLIPAQAADEVFAPLRRFLEKDPDARKLHQLALRVADLFDQYQVYRADWLEAWANGRDVLLRADAGPGRDAGVAIPPELRWQPKLWRLLLEDVGDAGAATSRADVHRRFLQACRDGQVREPERLPRRITVFGVSSLPQQTLEVLAALAPRAQVLLCVHNPCEHDWSHIVADQHLLRAARARHQRRPGTRAETRPELLHLQSQPLLAAWGRQGRDFIRLLDTYDERAAYEPHFAAAGLRIDHFERNAADTVLRQLQDDIRDLRPLAESRARWPAVDATNDRSIVFHVAHGPQREVEILHDQLLHAFAHDKTLSPRDVIVMVPDIGTYAAHVQAVFGQLGRDDPRHIPFSVADQAQRRQDPLLGALEQLLHLPQSRLSVSDVLDLLEVPALRARFDIDEAQLPLLHRWIQAARVRWGLHAQQREQLGLPAGLAQNTWAFGLKRMLLGYAVGAGPAWEGIEPLDEIGGLDAALLGPLVRLVDALDALWRTLESAAPPSAWFERLQLLLDTFFRAEDGSDDGFTLLKLRSALEAWLDACQDAALADPLTLPVVREDWLSRMEPSGLNQAFLSGGVTFASLMPMRAIPFRRVALLGMNDGDYPRSRIPMDFDLMARDDRPGDRSRREDDRYLFLEALLSARDHLHVSWVGRSIHDNEERPPSVLVAQLRDHLAAGWRLRGEPDDANGGAALVRALTVEHRLQPFHPSYFEGRVPALFSYAREWRASLAPEGLAAQEASHAALPPIARDGPLTLRLLGDFARDPVRSFLRERLGVDLREDDVVGQDQEPFDLNGLDNWQLQDELIQAQRAAVDAGQSREDALQERLDAFERRGELPIGAFAARVREELAAPMADLFAAYQSAREEWCKALDDVPLDVDFANCEPALRLSDTLGGMRRNSQDDLGRLVLVSSGLVQERRWRYDRLLPHWVAHLAGHLGGEPLTTTVLSKAGTARFPPMAMEDVERHWNALLEAWQDGMRRPLPFAVQSAHAFLQAGGGEAGEAAYDAARRVYDASEFDRPGECGMHPHLARAFPEFAALWSAGEFEAWAETLLRPLMDAVGKPPVAGTA